MIERWIIPMAKGVIKAPFFEIGPKAYLYGEKMLALAKSGFDTKVSAPAS